MKLKAFIAAAALVAVTVSSCGVLGSSTSSTAAADGSQTATSTTANSGLTDGQNSGTALRNLYVQYLTDGNTLNMGNPTNLLNMASLITSIQGMKGQTEKKTYYKNFAKGLILGSNNLVTETTSSTVANTLVDIANNVDMTQVSEKAGDVANTAAGYATTASNALSSASNIATSVSSILSLFGKK